MTRSWALVAFVAAVTLAAVAAVAAPAGEPARPAEPPPATAAGARYSLTVYSTADPASFDPRLIAQNRGGGESYDRIPGYGVVREVRRVSLAKGLNTLRFTDVAAGIDPTTVAFKSLTAPDSTSVVEQSFEYDLVDPDKLLAKYLGKSILINRKQTPLEGERNRMPETIEARLLAFTADQLVLQTNNKQLPVQIVPRNQDIQEIKLFATESGLVTKPTLVWKVEADKAGDHDVQVSYQTENLTWRADYSLVVSKDESRADLSAWVSIVNESGAAYPEAKLKLVAGDVHRLERERRVGYGGGGGGLFGGGRADTGFKEKSFFEYHLYTLGRPTSIANNATRQIELFPARADLPVERTYVYYGLGAEWHGMFPDPNTDRDLRVPGNKKVDVYLRLKNTHQNGLGIPLPAGRVRVYKRDDADPDDPAGSLEFVGEDKIDHTPREEPVLVRLGSAFDVVGDRRQTDFSVDEAKRTMTESFEIKLRNRKAQAVDVVVRETLYRWHNWEIAAATEKFQKQDSRTIHIPVRVEPDAEKTVTYTVRYTW